MIPDVPDYSANPARLAEKVAIPIVRHWVGSTGTVQDDSKTNAAFDFTIDYFDGRRAVGDVWLDADETLMAVWGDLFKQDQHHVVSLRPGSGTWSLGLTHDARGKALRLGLPALIEDCVNLGWTRVEFEYGWVAPDAPESVRNIYLRGRQLGIEYLSRHDSAASPLMNDAAMYFPKGDPRPASADPATVADWIGHVFRSPAGVKHVDGKLLPAVAEERHAFVVAHNGTPRDIQAQLARLAPSEPDLSVPDGITHVWVLPRHIEPSIGPIAGLWTRESGWLVRSY